MARFDFQQFSVDDRGCGMKICSDSVLLGAWFFAPYADAKTIVDVGAGSGILSLIGTQMCSEASVTALELDSGAAEASRTNFAESPFANRLNVEEGDFAMWKPKAGIDLVISNPPYFTNGERSSNSARATARHQDGLSYASLMRVCSQWLAADGHLGLVSPAEFENEIVFEAEMSGLKLRRLLRIRTSQRKPVTRILFDFSPTDGPLITDTLELRGSDSRPTPAYATLVENLYLTLK